MKKCHYCGKEVSEDAKYCWNCGREFDDRFDYSEKESIEGEVIERTDDSDTYVKEKTILRDEYSRRANNAFTLSIVSIFLCCCLITSLISLVLSLTLISDMNKMSNTTKNSPEFRAIRNKNIIALVISCLLIIYGIASYISQLMNPIDYNSVWSEFAGEYYGE